MANPLPPQPSPSIFNAIAGTAPPPKLCPNTAIFVKFIRLRKEKRKRNKNNLKLFNAHLGYLNTADLKPAQRTS
jgi:hypothetical protein